MRRRLLLPLAAVAGFAVALLSGIALARSFTLDVAKNATVTNQQHVTKHEAIAVNAKGRAVYWLSGDSIKHPECTKANGCLGLWPPVTVSKGSKPSAEPGIKDRLGAWRRDGFSQVTLGGHPLYTFAEDTQKDAATGEGVQGFGGTWSVVTASAKQTRSSGSTTRSGSGTPGMTTTTTTGTNAYPPGYY